MLYNVMDASLYIANYSNARFYSISNLKLQKLLYFIQAYFLVEKGEPCFAENIEAWSFGPVVPKSYREFKKFGGADIPCTSSYLELKEKKFETERKYFDPNIISPNDKNLINNVIDKFSNLSAGTLTQISLNQKLWIDTYYSSKSKIININDIKGYFCN